jgi:hypothetical protein
MEPLTLAARIELVRALAEKHGVVALVSEYEGSGDSGTIEPPTLEFAPHVKKVLSSRDSKLLLAQFTELLGGDYFLDKALDAVVGGWEINEGSRGKLRLDLSTCTMSVDHIQYVQAEEKSSHTLNPETVFQSFEQ